MKTEKKEYKTIRIYLKDHEKLLNMFPKNSNFAEIMHELVILKEKSNRSLT